MENVSTFVTFCFDAPEIKPLLAAPVAVFTLKSSKVLAYASNCLNLSINGEVIVIINPKALKNKMITQYDI